MSGVKILEATLLCVAVPESGNAICLCHNSVMGPCTVCEQRGDPTCTTVQGRCGCSYHKCCIDRWVQHLNALNQEAHCPSATHNGDEKVMWVSL